jgi:hypothetical protein
MSTLPDTGIPGNAGGLPPKPQPPRDEDCCRSDCPNCVFTLYERDLERWEALVAERRSASTPPDAA